MKLSVCPHDIVKQMKTWLAFATYLQRALDMPVTLEPVTDFAVFYRESLPHAELAFVNPMDAWKLVNERGFRPLFRTELYDEVVFITGPENTDATLAELRGPSCGRRGQPVRHLFGPVRPPGAGHPRGGHGLATLMAPSHPGYHEG